MSEKAELRALEAVLKLTALDERSAELKASLERIEHKLEVLLERLSKVEARCDRLERGEPEQPTATEPTSARVEPLSRSFLTSASEE